MGDVKRLFGDSGRNLNEVDELHGAARNVKIAGGLAEQPYFTEPLYHGAGMVPKFERFIRSNERTTVS